MKNWELRREVMGWDTDLALRLSMIVVVDNFDWNTNTKVFKDKHAFLAWVWGTAKRYNVPAPALKEALQVMREAGVIRVIENGDSKTMKLASPLDVATALEAYALRQENPDD